MKFWEAIKAISEGHKVRVIGWPVGIYVHMGQKEILDSNNEPWKECMYFGSTLCLKLEWEIYNPKLMYSEIGTIGGFRFLKSDGTIGHLKDGETTENGEQRGTKMNQWIEIEKESWPTDQEILLRTSDSIFYRGDKHFFQITGPSNPIGKLELTHWMALPSPPNECQGSRCNPEWKLKNKGCPK